MTVLAGNPFRGHGRRLRACTDGSHFEQVEENIIKLDEEAFHVSKGS
jgi:hypothetical protein